MKQIKTCCNIHFGATQSTNAQNKTAHVDVSEIMAKMPAMLECSKAIRN
jgi:outer membrane protein